MRTEVWDPRRPMSPNTLKMAQSEISVNTIHSATSTVSLGSLTGSISSLSSAGSVPEEGMEPTRVIYRTNSLTFFEEEEEEEPGNFDKLRRASAHGVAGEAKTARSLSGSGSPVDFIETLAEERRRKTLPAKVTQMQLQQPRSSSLPTPFKKTHSLPPTLPSGLVAAANRRLQATDNMSQEVLDRKARALERAEFAKNKKEQLLVRRHSSPHFSEQSLSAIKEVSEPEIEVKQHVSSPLACAPISLSPPPPTDSPSPVDDNTGKLGKRFQKRANSMALVSTLDGIDETEEDKEGMRRRSISEGSLHIFKKASKASSKSLKQQQQQQKGAEDPEEKANKRRSITSLFRGLRRLGSKSKIA